MTAALTSAPARRPHPLWTALEGRALFEYGSFVAMRGLLSFLPKGDGHPVLVLPGFLASDFSTGPMRRLLRDLGYEAHGWDLGRNIRINQERLDAMKALLERIYNDSGQKVSIVGWSLGGVFARELAKMMPEKVRLVISLGSPISGDRHRSRAGGLFRKINGKNPDVVTDQQFAKIGDAPSIPTTSILSKTDGVVHWQGSVQAKGEQTENIVVRGSHCGLGVNPSVMAVVADRLAQKEGEWKAFQRDGLKAVFFPKFDA